MPKPEQGHSKAIGKDVRFSLQKCLSYHVAIPNSQCWAVGLLTLLRYIYIYNPCAGRSRRHQTHADDTLVLVFFWPLFEIW